MNATSYTFLSSFYNKFTDRTDQRHLQTMQELLDLFSVDPSTMSIVQIAGSCGKGSTAHYISAMLTAANVSHGLFTGPHLEAYEERIQINGTPIASEDFDALLLRIKTKLDEHPIENAGHMHMMILAALFWYSEQGLSLIIFENGVGGRSDPSNILEPTIAVLTEMTLDHADLLGGTIQDIANDKAAIVKPCTKQLIMSIENKAAQTTVVNSIKRVPITQLNSDFFVHWEGDQLHYKGLSHSIKGLPMISAALYQKNNAATALAVIEALQVNGVSINWPKATSALEWTTIPCRYEKLARDGKDILIDGAHNPFELQALVAAMQADSFMPERVVVSFTSGRSLHDMIQSLSPINATFDVIASPFVERRISLQMISTELDAANISWTYYEDIDDYVTHHLPTSGKILITGSLYLAGYIRKTLAQSVETLNN
ncbi:bifunctional folylpolyglutamate synthase/dihydrofolate synthase [Aureibacillus halotolerans]|uniref:Dihydrofolate synthase/folylpolyglutamate synthase n=1 Tax=Aureibacillus halotolerans TaxID=1508390 RepID=A0A4R6TYL7_9BACI|nr:Mur ligase family protein [Aureibacillus halotolerans]TDQ37952.1 dihydrofolate synthase/folylpolyglutamate synthase [Aureibacillus halotolerans]